MIEKWLSECSKGQCVREAGCWSILYSSRSHRHTLSLALCHCCTATPISISALLMLYSSLLLMTNRSTVHCSQTAETIILISQITHFSKGALQCVHTTPSVFRPLQHTRKNSQETPQLMGKTDNIEKPNVKMIM